jgi:hypothetical protein
LTIENAEAYRLAAEIAQVTGLSLERVVVEALQHEKERITPRKFDRERVRQILAEVDSLPVRDARSAAEILGDLYDEQGLPK